MSDYDEVVVFKGSCSKCGVYQTHEQSRCMRTGCLVLHHYPEVRCKCGEVLVRGTGLGAMMNC